MGGGRAFTSWNTRSLYNYIHLNAWFHQKIPWSPGQVLVLVWVWLYSGNSAEDTMVMRMKNWACSSTWNYMSQIQRSLYLGFFVSITTDLIHSSMWNDNLDWGRAIGQIYSWHKLTEPYGLSKSVNSDSVYTSQTDLGLFPIHPQHFYCLYEHPSFSLKPQLTTFSFPKLKF